MSPHPRPSTGKPVGRPRADTDLVAASIAGRGIAWINGEFSGDTQLVKDAQQHALDATPTRLRYGGAVINAGADSPESAAAAMIAIDPGRGSLTTYPEAVAQLLLDHEADLGQDDD